MASDDEDAGDLNYGVDDDYSKAFGKSNSLKIDEEEIQFEEYEEGERCLENDSLKIYKKNPKTNEPLETEENNEDAALEDLLNLIENDDHDEVQEKNDKEESEFERGKVSIKKDKLITNQKSVEKSEIEEKAEKRSNESSGSPKRNFSKSSIKIEKINTDPSNNAVLIEKNTGLRLTKSPFKSESELNLNVSTGFGRFYKLSELSRRMIELKNQDSTFNWYSIFILGSKTESKCSAKGNNYVIWRLYDMSTLDNTQDISLFLFGNAYKQWWKQSEMDVFALIKPEFLDSNKNNQTNTTNNNPNSKSYYDSSSHTVTKKGIITNNKSGGWNNFAAKKLNLAEKVTMSIKSDFQLVFLGSAKDISVCQSFSKSKNEPNIEASKKCKNLVNLQQGPYCTYHSMMFDKNAKKGGLLANNNNRGKYSMDKPSASPLNRFGTQELFAPTINKSEDVKFLPHKDMVKRSTQKPNGLDDKAKIKAEIIMSLNTNISQTSATLSNVVIKTNKKTDQELLALLEGKELDKEEIRRIRLEEQSAVIKYQRSNANDQQSSEMKKLFSSKLLLPSESNCFQSISSQKLVDLKKTLPEDLSKSNDLKAYNNKKNYSLSTMQSHRDILKEIKQKKDDPTITNKQKIDDSKSEVIELSIENSKSTQSNNIIAADFLQKRINEIKRMSQQSKSSSAPSSPVSTNKDSNKKEADKSGFDLELFIGDSVTSKKLLDVSSKYVPFSPLTATSDSQKRKLEEISPKNVNNKDNKGADEIIMDRKAKRLKMIEDMLKIKSNHSKDVMDPEKNPQLKSYYDKLQLQEDVSNKLCSIRNREVNLCTCKVCNYTSFKQSDFCKLKKHQVVFHKGMQRFFKCKSCGKRMFTLDQLCPTKPCGQCSSDKYEPCTMKEEDISIKLNLNGDSKLNQESEMFIELDG